MTRVLNRFVNEGWVQEVPSGTINGSNVTFTLAFTPDDPNAVEIYLNGLRQYVTTHYTISGSTITMVTAPAVAQNIYALYTKKL